MIKKLIHKVLDFVINILIDITDIIDKHEVITFGQYLKQEGFEICPNCEGDGVIPTVHIKNVSMWNDGDF